MLSFLRDQGNGNLPAQQPGPAGETAPSDGTEKPQEQEYLTVAANGKKARKSTTLLAILFIVGLLCLGYMIRKSTPKTASASSENAEDKQIEAAVSRLTGVKSEMSDGMDAIVKKFYEFSNVLQIGVGELVKNPFKLELYSANVKEESRVEIKVPEVDTEMIKQRQIRRQAQEMQLLSIMKSDRGVCCMIGNKILYEGDYIGDFRVRQIGDSFVKLEWDQDRNSGSSDTQSEAVEIMLNLID
ncbi:MAG: hypothetical protein ACYSUX_01295 [Planctomycetota bacterium]|jgi:preprotein translocase subunit SecG